MRVVYAAVVLAFPRAVLIALPRPLAQHRALVLAWILVLVALAQRFFLMETGPRASHGNWHWGYFIALTILLTYSAASLVALPKRSAYTTAAWVVFWLHVWSGSIYVYGTATGMGFRG